MASDFNLFYIQDIRVGEMSDFSSLIAVLSSTLWKHGKCCVDLLSMIRERNGEESNIGRITFLGTLVTPIWEPFILTFVLCSLLRAYQWFYLENTRVSFSLRDLCFGIDEMWFSDVCKLFRGF